MTDDSKAERRKTDHVTRQVARHRQQSNSTMRKMVRNMVTHMECVLRDIRGIMGDIQTLVVQIDSVTNKIDAHCSKAKEENHVVRKPEMIDCQTYWSRTISKNCMKETKATDKQKENEQSLGYEVPVYPAGLYPPENPIHQRLDSPSKLSNVERWLVQENAKCYERVIRHSSKAQYRKTLKCTKSSDRQCDTSRKQPFIHPRSNFPNSLYIPHVVKQPCARHCQQNDLGGNEKKTRAAVCDSTPSDTDYNNVKYERIRNDETLLKDVNETKKSPDYLSPHAQPQQSVLGKLHKPICVYNSHYEENTSNTDESPIEANPSKTKDRSNNEFSVIMPQFLHSKTSNLPADQPSAIPESPRILKHSHFLSTSTHINRKCSRPVSRNQRSVDSESHKYQSLESDLDSITDCNDPRCITPDMDWSYLGLVGGTSTRILDKSSKHVYETIGSPVFQRRKAKYTRNVTKSVSFQTSPDVVSKLICIENLNFVSGTPESDSSGRGNCFNSQDSSIVDGLEELNGSIVLDHVFCQEVPDPRGDNYCGYYEAVADAVLENVSGYSSLEEACAALESRSEILGETYIGFDDEFFDDEWDIGIKSSSDYYFEDDLDFSMALMPRRKININSRYFDAIRLLGVVDTFDVSSSDTSRVEDDAAFTDMDVSPSVPLGRQPNPSNDESKAMLDISELLHYDDLNIANSQLRETDTSTEADQCRDKGKSSFWNQFGDEPVAQVLAHSSTSSEEGSDEAMASGSSNMSFGSVDVSLTPPECEEGTSLVYSVDTKTLTTSTFSTDDYLPQASEYSEMGGNYFQSVSSAFQEVGCLCDVPSVNAQMESVQSRRKNSLSVNNECETTCDASVDDPIAYNRNVNTWTAYAMVHVPADEISDSASDIINDNSVNNSMTSSYLDADNSTVAQKNQGFVDK